MSRIGKKPVVIPSGVTVKVAGGEVAVSGPKGSMRWRFPTDQTVALDEGGGFVGVVRKNDSKQARANHGLTRSLLANMVHGVSEGFEKKLEIYGTGYNCKLQGRVLHLNIGFMGRNRGRGAQFELPVPEGVEVVVEKDAARGDAEPALLTLRSYDKQAVGQFAAEIRGLRTTEPYKGKGVRYAGEQVRRKQGKALGGGA